VFLSTGVMVKLHEYGSITIRFSLTSEVTKLQQQLLYLFHIISDELPHLATQMLLAIL
jgi:hypothetical protein